MHWANADRATADRAEEAGLSARQAEDEEPLSGDIHSAEECRHHCGGRHRQETAGAVSSAGWHGICEHLMSC